MTNQINMKKLIAFSVITLATLVAPLSVSAATVCTPVYGGGQTCVTTGPSINKTIKNPSSGAYVDNLLINDPKYSANDSVSYQITVTNPTGTAMTALTVTDDFPTLISYVS